MGKTISYTHDIYTWYGSSCVFEKTLTTGLYDKVLRAPKKKDKSDGEVCKYTISFKTSCKADDNCSKADRTVLFYTFEDKTLVRPWLEAYFGSLSLLVMQLYFTPMGLIMSFFGKFKFTQLLMGEIINFLLPPAVRSNTLYINLEGEVN